MPRNDEGISVLPDQPGQLPHIVKRHGRPRGAKRVAVTRTAMAAAMKAKNGHSGGQRAGDAGQCCPRSPGIVREPSPFARPRTGTDRARACRARPAQRRKYGVRSCRKARCGRGSTGIRSCEPLEATQTGCAIAASASIDMGNRFQRYREGLEQLGLQSGCESRPAGCGPIRLRPQDAPGARSGRGSDQIPVRPRSDSRDASGPPHARGRK